MSILNLTITGLIEYVQKIKFADDWIRTLDLWWVALPNVPQLPSAPGLIFLSTTVWTDFVKQKSPKFSISGPKSNHSSVTEKVKFFKMAPKSWQTFGLQFCVKTSKNCTIWSHWTLEVDHDDDDDAEIMRTWKARKNHQTSRQRLHRIYVQTIRV